MKCWRSTLLAVLQCSTSPCFFAPSDCTTCRSVLWMSRTLCWTSCRKKECTWYALTQTTYSSEVAAYSCLHTRTHIHANTYAHPLYIRMHTPSLHTHPLRMHIHTHTPLSTHTCTCTQPPKPYEVVLLWGPQEAAEQLCIIESTLFGRIGNRLVQESGDRDLSILAIKAATGIWWS